MPRARAARRPARCGRSAEGRGDLLGAPGHEHPVAGLPQRRRRCRAPAGRLARGVDDLGVAGAQCAVGVDERVGEVVVGRGGEAVERVVRGEAPEATASSSARAWSLSTARALAGRRNRSAAEWGPSVVSPRAPGQRDPATSSPSPRRLLAVLALVLAPSSLLRFRAAARGLPRADRRGHGRDLRRVRHPAAPRGRGAAHRRRRAARGPRRRPGRPVRRAAARRGRPLRRVRRHGRPAVVQRRPARRRRRRPRADLDQRPLRDPHLRQGREGRRERPLAQPRGAAGDRLRRPQRRPSARTSRPVPDQAPRPSRARADAGPTSGRPGPSPRPRCAACPTPGRPSPPGSVPAALELVRDRRGRPRRGAVRELGGGLGRRPPSTSWPAGEPLQVVGRGAAAGVVRAARPARYGAAATSPPSPPTRTPRRSAAAGWPRNLPGVAVQPAASTADAARLVARGRLRRGGRGAGRGRALRPRGAGRRDPGQRGRGHPVRRGRPDRARCPRRPARTAPRWSPTSPTTTPARCSRSSPSSPCAGVNLTRIESRPTGSGLGATASPSTPRATSPTPGSARRCPRCSGSAPTSGSSAPTRGPMRPPPPPGRDRLHRSRRLAADPRTVAGRSATLASTGSSAVPRQSHVAARSIA